MIPTELIHNEMHDLIFRSMLQKRAEQSGVQPQTPASNQPTTPPGGLQGRSVTPSQQQGRPVTPSQVQGRPGTPSQLQGRPGTPIQGKI